MLFASCTLFLAPSAALLAVSSMTEAMRPNRSIHPGMRPTPRFWQKALQKSRQL